MVDAYAGTTMNSPLPTPMVLVCNVISVMISVIICDVIMYSVRMTDAFVGEQRASRQ